VVNFLIGCVMRSTKHILRTSLLIFLSLEIRCDTISVTDAHQDQKTTLPVKVVPPGSSKCGKLSKDARGIVADVDLCLEERDNEDSPNEPNPGSKYSYS